MLDSIVGVPEIVDGNCEEPMPVHLQCLIWVAHTATRDLLLTGQLLRLQQRRRNVVYIH